MEKPKGSKKGKQCMFQNGKICDENCGGFNIGLDMCVLHSINMHIKEQADRTDRSNQLFAFIEKKLGTLIGSKEKY